MPLRAILVHCRGVRTALIFLILAGFGFHAGCSAPPSPPAAGPSKAAPGNGLALVAGRAPVGALVMLEPAAGAVPMPEGNAVLDQFSKAFVPDTLFVRVGQPVTIKNSEDQLHNITVVRSRTGRGVLNISQSQGEVHNHTFDQTGEYDVSCDVHPGMKATIVATTTPYATYVEANGTFSIANVPAGEYRLRISDDGKESERRVTVSGARVDITP
jgi:plastocyanin